MTYIPKPPFLDESSISTTHTSAQSVGVTRAVISGSEIEYTPDPEATHVLYEFAFQWANEPDANTHLYISLMEKATASDPWTYVTNKSFAIACMDSSNACSFENVEILLPAWSGSKYLSLYIRSALSTTEGRLHQLKMDDGSFNAGTEGYVNTFLQVTSLRSY